jgi:asparagine synthase (glutamine-hydrolysing)
MCGICGVIAVDGVLNPDLADAIGPMTMSLRHRGPDGEGVFRDLRAALGHRRLAIIDRDGGVQPMTDGAGVWIVFNGEIYNHRDLRRQLEARGYVFRTHSDTEVILHAYSEYGVDCLRHLHGMFAFAIYDSVRAEALLARDRLGKKPMFYAVLDGALHFGSEMKALAESPAWRGSIDASAIEGYLTLGYILAPDTIYEGVFKLEPGHWLQLKNGKVTCGKYWDVERFDDHPGAAAAIQAEVADLLRQAVIDRLESEVPLGAFLSGGIDSGLVVSYMAEAMADPVKTTSVGFGEKGHNELHAASLTAAHWHTSHVSEIVEPRLEQVLDRIVSAFDEPFADSSAIPTYYVSQMARRQVTVALSGDGGDESFGGYDFRYLPHAFEDAVRKMVPEAARQGVFGWAAGHWPRSRKLPRALRLATLFDNIAVDAPAAYFADLCYTKPPVVRRLLAMPERADYRASRTFEAVTRHYRHCSSAQPIQRAEYADLKVYLPNDVLVKVDRMSMAHSLEVRCPLLDHRIVELAFRIPQSRKLPWLKAKHLLRQIGRARLPEALHRLPKHGFSAPVGDWMARTYRAAFAGDVLTTTSFAASHIDIGHVRTMLDAHVRGDADHSYALWSIWMMERWAQQQAQSRFSIEVPIPCHTLSSAG